jgi:hypothetical protein
MFEHFFDAKSHFAGLVICHWSMHFLTLKKMSLPGHSTAISRGGRSDLQLGVPQTATTSELVLPPTAYPLYTNVGGTRQGRNGVECGMEVFAVFCCLKSHFAWRGRGLRSPHGGRASSDTTTIFFRQKYQVSKLRTCSARCSGAGFRQGLQSPSACIRSSSCRAEPLCLLLQLIAVILQFGVNLCTRRAKMPLQL